MSKFTLTNVKKHLEYVIYTCDALLEENGKHKGGTVLAPIDVDNLKELRFLTQCILKKHAAKKTRKDIYVPRR